MRVCLAVVPNMRVSLVRRASALARGPFKVLTGADMARLSEICGAAHVVTDADELKPYNTDWMRRYKGRASVALLPRETSEVEEIVRYCHGQRIALVPQGGNTGLVGGSVPVFDEVVLSLKRMNRILSFDTTAGVLTCQAGCVLDALNARVGEAGHTMPIDLGASGSCHIGGNVATNAGGIRLLRYGSLRNTILGLEAVTPGAGRLDLLSSLRKDNTGLDLKQLFIGSEGMLGVITAVSILTPALLASRKVMLLGCATFDAVLGVYRAAKAALGETLSAVEFLDRASMETVIAAGVGADPLAEPHEFYVLIETTGASASHDGAKLEGFLDASMSNGLVADGVLSASESQFAALWRLREDIAPSLGHGGRVAYKYDLSLPQTFFYRMVELMRERVAAAGGESATGVVRVLGYGHLGDGNLHLNFVAREFSERTRALLEPHVFEVTASQRGSISAEHGIGLGKAQHLHFCKPPAAVAVMRGIKRLFDPHGIMNPYKVLGDECGGEMDVRLRG